MRERRSHRPLVISRHGRHRFQSGLVTGELMRRGIPMDVAIELSHRLKEAIAGRRTITTRELEHLLESLLEERFPGAVPPPPSPRAPDFEVRVRDGGQVLPFSRGVLLRHLVTVGLGVDAAHELAQDIVGVLRASRESVVEQEFVDREVLRRLAADHGPEPARRYRLLRWLRRADRPVILMVGGATGTGKSTLATELAYRLGIPTVTSTDMIRETLRAVLPPAVVPGLHDHSFRGLALGAQVLSNPRERVLAGFRQQAEQVAVGIRAIVRRAIREHTHLVIEGTHLLPPFERFLPSGQEAYVAGVLLAVTDEELHRERFHLRAGQARQRRAEDYLEAFQAVRWIHDDLVRLAEETEEVAVISDELDLTLPQVLGVFAQLLPVVGPGTARRPLRTTVDQVHAPTLVVVLDGLSDEPLAELGGRTPLGAARTPVLDRLAGAGSQGCIRTGGEDGRPPGTHRGLLALLAQPEPGGGELGRGVFEALGAGVEIPRTGLLLRGNLATVDAEGRLVDRRAGRIRDEVDALLAGLRTVHLDRGYVGCILPTHEHRVVVILRGGPVSRSVADVDPGAAGIGQVLPRATPLDDDPVARATAQALQALLDHAARHLAAHPHNQERAARGLPPANCIITRGASLTSDLPRRRPGPRRAAMISGCATALGVARAFGFGAVTDPRFTGNLDTDLDAKFEHAARLLDDHQLVVIHVKGTDIAAHDRRPDRKRALIERFDTALGRFLEGREGLRVVVTADHGTSSRTGRHLPDPVPLLVAHWNPGEEPARFDETTAASGILGELEPGELGALLSGHEAEAPVGEAEGEGAPAPAHRS